MESRQLVDSSNGQMVVLVEVVPSRSQRPEVRDQKSNLFTRLLLTKIEKLHYPSLREEMELYQRTGQLAIVSVMGRGTPVAAKLLPCSRGVKDAVLIGISTEVGSRRSEVGSRRSEVGGRRSEVRGRRSEVGSRRSEVGSQRTEDR